MRAINRRNTLALLGGTALSACASPAIVTRDAVNDPFEGGIGGTGIVGTLTGFGSLRINGLRVELSNTTRFISPFGPTDAEALATGMSLTVFATQYKDRLLAHRVSVDYALVGRVERGSAGGMMVNGVAVLPEHGAVGQMVLGQRVAVSGAWSSAGLVASRIDPAPDARDLVAGDVGGSENGAPKVSGVSVMADNTQLRAGQYAVAIGRYSSGQMEVERLLQGRFSARAALRQLSVEGFLGASPMAPGFRVVGLGHSFGPDVRLAPLAQRRAIYFGPYSGLFEARAGYVVPQNFSERRLLLRRGFSDGFDGTVINTQ